MRPNPERGFTWPEILILIVIFSIILVIALPNMHPFATKNKSREAEVKSNIHTIQIALERYFTDHSEYPPYLLGGDIDGWLIWHERWDGINDIEMADGRIASNNIVVDPLIEQVYITSYPSNPFVADGLKIIARTTDEISIQHGMGDPRFGYKGNIMGMGLDDPAWFCGSLQPDSQNYPEIETRRTLDHGDYLNVPEAFTNPKTNPYYLFGGFRSSENEGEVTKTWWPGNFFYRARGDQQELLDSGSYALPHARYKTPPTHYILGGYGPLKTDGMDVIRLTPLDPDWNRVSWRYPISWPSDQYFCGYGFQKDQGTFGGLPEVFGGGYDFNGPYFPYIDPIDSENGIMYGAPDGVKDGVNIILTEPTGFVPR